MVSNQFVLLNDNFNDDCSSTFESLLEYFNPIIEVVLDFYGQFCHTQICLILTELHKFFSSQNHGWHPKNKILHE